METRQAARIADALKEMVFTGQFHEGQRLDEARLAARFGVSRTPIREALQRLVAVRLAEQVPRRGVFVRPPTATSVIEMFETMAEIEGICGRLAAERMPPEGLRLLEDINARCTQALAVEDATGYAHQNEAFHQQLYRLSGNTFLEDQARALYARLKPFRRIQFQLRGRMAASADEHIALLRALGTGDTDLTVTILRQHIGTQGARFFEQMNRLTRDPDIRIAS